ncbi:MAG TPA: fibronectin type III domain-containing protein [Mariniflexile sp.]
MKKLLLLIITLCFFNCDDIIEVVDISEETVTVLAPMDGVLVEDANITFTWDAVEEAESYKIQIAKPSFEAAQQIAIDSLVTTTFFNTTLLSGSYEWRVRAENSGYETLFTSQKFTVSAPDPVDITNEQVVVLAPTDGNTFLTTDTINFSWETIDGANEYAIQIATPDFDNPVETIKDENLTATTVSVSNLSANAYKFRVKAKNSSFETGYTEIGFTVNE